jgi:hypothetical protein
MRCRVDVFEGRARDFSLTLVDKHLLPLLDGTRDSDELTEELLFHRSCGRDSVGEER